MKILFLSHTGPTGPFVVGSHHLSRELAAAGHRVAHVSNPIALAHLVRAGDPEVRARARLGVPMRVHERSGVGFAVPWSVLPMAPDLPLPPLFLGSARLLRRRLDDAGLLPADLVLVDQPMLAPLLRQLPHRGVVYRPTDINTGRRARRAEEDLLPRVAGVVATSQVVLDALRSEHRVRAGAVVGNGVEIGHFERARQLAAAAPPAGRRIVLDEEERVSTPTGVQRGRHAAAPAPQRAAEQSAGWDAREGAVYVGALDRRFDWDVVRRLGRSRPEIAITLHGPVPGDVPELPPNVDLAGPVPYERLPEVLARYRVGLLPLNADPTNSGRSPMKLYEYLAAGLTVVSRRTTPIARAGLADVHLYDDAAGAVTALDAGLAAPPGPAALEAARAMDWSARAAIVLDEARRMVGR